jgi:drug/metabolite transporter superfamily protein YnfA
MLTSIRDVNSVIYYKESDSTDYLQVDAGQTGVWRARYGPLPGVTAREVAGLLAIGVLATVGQLVMTRAYALDKAGRVGAAGQVQIVFAVALDAAVFGRRPEGAAAAGIALLACAGALLVQDARREGGKGEGREGREGEGREGE